MLVQTVTAGRRRAAFFPAAWRTSRLARYGLERPRAGSRSARTRCSTRPSVREKDELGGCGVRGVMRRSDEAQTEAVKMYHTLIL